MGLVNSAKCCRRHTPRRADNGRLAIGQRRAAAPSPAAMLYASPTPCCALRPITHSYVSCGCECFNCTRAPATLLPPTLPRRAVALLYNCELRGQKHSTTTKQAHFAKKRGLRSLDAAVAPPRRPPCDERQALYSIMTAAQLYYTM